MAVDNSNREAVVDREAIAAAAALVGSVEANPPVDRLVVTEAHPPPLLEADLKADTEGRQEVVVVAADIARDPPASHRVVACRSVGAPVAAKDTPVLHRNIL
jgi:hypothetical protein